MAESTADKVQDSEGRQYHIGLARGEVADRILLVGDPARVDKVAERMDSVRLRKACREYVTATGSHHGRELTVMGTGIGCDNTEIAVMELLQCVDAPTFIRVGSCGSLQPDLDIGGLAITTGAVRLESTSLAFVDESYPAVAHHEVVLALVSAARELGLSYKSGLTATAAGFYGWQGRTGGAIEPLVTDTPERLSRQGVVNMEMEASTLLTLAALAGLRASAVCTVFANRLTNRFIASEDKAEAEGRAIDVALRALDYLADMDARAGEGAFHLEPPTG